MPLSEHVYCVAITFKVTEWVEQRICIRFCIKLEHSSMETIWMIQKAAAMGDWQLHHDTSSAEFFCETSNHPGDSAPYSPGTLQLLAFPQTKVTFEREETSDCWWDSGKYDGQLMVIGRTVWGPKVPTLKGTDGSSFYIQCVLYLVSSSINVSIFRITCLDTFWKDLLVLSAYGTME